MNENQGSRSYISKARGLCMQYVWIGVGGALGSVLRFILQNWLQSGTSGVFPTGTLAVNLLGSSLVGFISGLFETLPVSMNLRLFLMVGLLGGFTTFSAYSLGNLTLIREGQGRMALLYIVASNAFGILLAFGGYFAARLLLRGLNAGQVGG